jgi:hypothetical protein
MRQFDREIILLCVRWYLRYMLSLRDLVEMMAERGVNGTSLGSRSAYNAPTAFVSTRATYPRFCQRVDQKS